MKIDFDGIQAFVAVAETGGFGKAAAFLNLTQTALTRRVQKLESYLDARLLDRTTRMVQLTPVGRDFLPQAQRLVADMTAVVSRVRDASRSRRGEVTLGCVPSMAHQWLPDFIRRYALAHPGNRIRILDLSATAIAEAVLQGQAEFGIPIVLTRNPDLIEQPILREPFVLFCRDDHPLASERSVNWADLRAEDLIVVSSASGNRAMLDYQLARQRIDFNGTYEVNHPSTALGLVDAGVGIAILARSTLQEGTHPRVRRISIARPTVSRTISLIRRRNASLSPPAQAFHELLLHDAPPVGGRRKTPRKASPK
jgi:DNA-binding transcriptional LysR family regulator